MLVKHFVKYQDTKRDELIGKSHKIVRHPLTPDFFTKICGILC